MAYTPSPSIITGGTGLGNIQSQQRKYDVSSDIAYYDPNANPFFLLAQESNKKESIDPEFRCLEAQQLPVLDAVNQAAGVTAAATTVVVDHDEYFKANDLVQNTRTKEIFLVSGVTAATSTLTIVRGYGSVGGQAMLDDDELRRVGNAFEEGAAVDTAKTVQIDSIVNYCQIFKTALNLTNTQMASQVYGEDSLAGEQKRAGVEHAMKIESAFLFGQRQELLTTSATNPTTSHPLRTTGGILFFISSNTLSVGGALTEATFNQSFLKDIFTADLNYRKKRTLFVSPLVGAIMNQWANGKIQLVPPDQTFGISVSKYLSFFGEVNIVCHPLLNGSVYGGYAIAVDLESVGYRYLTGRDTKLETDIVQAGADARTDQYISECGLMVRLEGVHGYAYGITG